MACSAVQSPSSTSQLPVLHAGLLHAAAHGGIALRIQVDQQHASLRGRQRSGKVDGGGGLAHAALLVRHCDDAFHCAVSLRGSYRAGPHDAQDQQVPLGIQARHIDPARHFQLPAGGKRPGIRRIRAAGGQRPFIATTLVRGPHSGAIQASSRGSGAKARVITVSKVPASRELLHAAHGG